MATGRKARVAVNGYGVIGKRVADAVALQDDMELVGVADVSTDYRIRVAVERGYPVYASVPEKRPGMEDANIPVQGLSLIHISEPTRLLSISYAVFCLKKKKKRTKNRITYVRK